MSLKLAALYATTLLAGCPAKAPHREPTAPLEPTTPASALELSPRPCTNAYRLTEVGADPESNSIVANVTPNTFEPSLPYWVYAAYDSERARFVTADQVRGVRAIDARDAKRPAISPVFWPPGHPEDLRVTGDRALLVASVPNDDYARDLFWLSLSPAPFRVVLQHKVFPALRALYVLRATSTSMTVVAVTDEVRREPECTARTGTTLRQLELRDDGIYETATLDLGDNVDGILRSGDWLLVQDGERSYRAEPARFVRIRNGARDLQVSKPYPLGGRVVDFHADAQSLRLVISVHAESDRARHRLVGIARMETLRVASSGAVERIAVCEHTQDAVREKGSTALSVGPYVARAVFAADRTLLAVHEQPGDPSDRIAIVDSKTCGATPFPGGIVVMPANEQAAVLAIGNESRVLETRVYDLEQSAVQKTSVRAVLKAESVPRASRYRGYNAYQPFEAQVHKTGSRAWLAVPFRELDKAGVLRAGTQLFELDKTGLTLGPKLDGTLWIISEQGRAVLRSPTGLQIVQLQEGSAPERIGALDHWPGYSDGLIIGDAPASASERRMIARVRWNADPPTYDPRTDAPFERLEIVAGDDDPQLGRALASFPIGRNARLYHVGQHAVAIAHPARDQSTVLVFFVLDLRKPNAPAMLGPYQKPGAQSLRFLDGEVELLPEPFPERASDPTAYKHAGVFPDETLLDVRDDELLLLRYASIRRTRPQRLYLDASKAK